MQNIKLIGKSPKGICVFIYIICSCNHHTQVFLTQKNARLICKLKYSFHNALGETLYVTQEKKYIFISFLLTSIPPES